MLLLSVVDSVAKVGTWDAQGSCMNMRLASLIGLKVGLTAIMDTHFSTAVG